LQAIFDDNDKRKVLENARELVSDAYDQRKIAAESMEYYSTNISHLWSGYQQLSKEKMDSLVKQIGKELAEEIETNKLRGRIFTDVEKERKETINSSSGDDNSVKEQVLNNLGENLIEQLRFVVVTDKSFFSIDTLNKKGKSYLLSGDTVKGYSVSDNWIFAEYTNNNGHKTVAYLLRSTVVQIK
jgi:hypothetical protein